MKKIIALLIISTFFVSCTNKNEDIKTTNAETEIEIGKEIETIIEEEIKIENEAISEQKMKEDIDKANEETIIKEIVTEKTSDEAALEAEVNDLLDEFIDSLDSYDK